MSFIIRNISGAIVEIDDIGILLEIGEDINLAEEASKDIAISTDLVDAVQALDIIVLDPLDGSTPLTVTQSVEAIQVANDTHFRIRGGELSQLDDVVLTVPADGYVLTYNQIAQMWEPQPAGGTGSGEANTASNLGAGEGWFAQKVVADLQFKSLTTGSNITLSSSATEVNIVVDETTLTITESQISDLQSYLLDIIGESIGDLGDVDLTGLVNGQALMYNSTSGNWEVYTPTDNDTTDHTLLSNIGVNTHAQIDTHPFRHHHSLHRSVNRPY